MFHRMTFNCGSLAWRCLLVAWIAMVQGFVTHLTLRAADEAPAPAAVPPADQPRQGRLLRIEPPLTDQTEQQIRRAVQETIASAKSRGHWPVFVLVIEPGNIPFGKALELALFLSSPELNGARTIAYVPQKVIGHGTLLALACDEIILGPEAQLGDAGHFEVAVIDQTLRSGYASIANRRRTVPAPLALGMLDSDEEVALVETEVAREFVLARDLEALRKAKAIRSTKTIKKAGDPGLFTARQLRDWGVVSYLADDKQEIARLWKLSRDALADDPSLASGWQTAKFELTGPVTAEKTARLQNLVQSQLRERGLNFVCLWLDSPGGSPMDSKLLADYLASLDPRKYRTVAYIPNEARADAAFIALACDQVVMRPGATLGGAGAVEFDRQDLPLLAAAVRDIAKAKGRSPSLAAALVDPEKRVFRYVHKVSGVTEFYTPAEAEQLKNAGDWRQEAEVTEPGVALVVDGRRAVDLGLANQVVNNFAEFRGLYGLEHDPQLVQPSWATTLIDALNAPGVAWFLLFIGLAALYAELQTPGIGLGGVIGTLCFLLFFWSQFLNGTAGWLEVLMFLTGVVMVLLEIFVLPGVAIFGFTGGLLILASIVLASQTFVWPHNAYQLDQLKGTLLAMGGLLAATIVAAIFMNRFLPHTPGLNRMVLAPPTGDELSTQSRREATAQFDNLLGARGTATTPLVPGGKARFGEQLVDVMSDGGFVDRGQAVEVVEVRGNRVVVKTVSS